MPDRRGSVVPDYVNFVPPAEMIEGVAWTREVSIPSAHGKKRHGGQSIRILVEMSPWR
jgi:hypothetical protein